MKSIFTQTEIDVKLKMSAYDIEKSLFLLTLALILALFGVLFVFCFTILHNKFWHENETDIIISLIKTGK